MMAVEGPFLAAVIARMEESSVNLAAFGIAYAFALVAEAPVIMLLSAATRLGRGRSDYLRLRTFSLALCGAVTIFLCLLLTPPVFHPLSNQVLNLSPGVAGHVHQALLLLLPWPAAIGMRRFYQGILIAHHQPGRVALGTITRLMGMAIVAIVLGTSGLVPGASLGACALSAGVSVEALATRFLARRAIKNSLRNESAEPEMHSFQALFVFFLPLAMTPLIGLSIHPVVTFFLGHGSKPLESLAIMPVLYALTFLFRALGLSFPEVAITVLKENPLNVAVVRRFALYLGLFLGAGLSMIAFTPLNQIWFAGVSGLPENLASLAVVPLQIMAVFPALTVAVGYQRALLIHAGVTPPVSLATALEAVGIFTVLAVLVLYSTLPGITAAAIAYMVGRFLALIYLLRPCARALVSIETDDFSRNGQVV